MMGDATALKLAMDLLHVPSRVRSMRAAALPQDVVTLLAIAAGDAEVTRQSTQASGRTQEAVRNAATFFIEQILLAPDSDSYRVLGGNSQTITGDLRRNMALLLRWLHPDMEHNGSGDRSLFAGRVTQAWENLKTAERRTAYDKMQQKRGAATSKHRDRTKGRAHQAGKRASISQHTVTRERGAQPPNRLLRALLTLLGVARH